MVLLFMIDHHTLAKVYSVIAIPGLVPAEFSLNRIKEYHVESAHPKKRTLALFVLRQRVFALQHNACAHC